MFAKETASMLFAPSLFLFSVPSKSINLVSISSCFEQSSPISSGLIYVSILLKAFSTPLP